VAICQFNLQLQPWSQRDKIFSVSPWLCSQIGAVGARGPGGL